MASTIEWDKLPVISTTYKKRYGNVPHTRTIRVGTKRHNITFVIERKTKPDEFERNWKKQFEKEYLDELRNPASIGLRHEHGFPYGQGGYKAQSGALTVPSHAGAPTTRLDLSVLDKDLTAEEVMDSHCAWALPVEETPEPIAKPVKAKTKKTKKKGRDNGTSS